MSNEDHDEWVRQSLLWLETYYCQFEDDDRPADCRSPKSQATIDELKRRVGVQ